MKDKVSLIKSVQSNGLYFHQYEIQNIVLKSEVISMVLWHQGHMSMSFEFQRVMNPLLQWCYQFQ